MINSSTKILTCLISILCFNTLVNAQKLKTLPIYNNGDTTTLWHPSGWMPKGDGIAVNSKFQENDDNICVKISFAPKKESKKWVGVYWLVENWEGPGINVYEMLGVEKDTPIKLTFRVRGDKGGERVQFKVGGVTDGNDSMEFPVSNPYKTLSTSWESDTLNVSNEDLSNVVGGFCAVTSATQNPKTDVVRFYLDDIKFEVVQK